MDGRRCIQLPTTVSTAVLVCCFNTVPELTSPCRKPATPPSSLLPVSASVHRSCGWRRADVSADNGRLDIVRQLLAVPGIDTHVKGEKGRTAAEWAAAQGHAEIAALIALSGGRPTATTALTVGSKVDARDQAGKWLHATVVERASGRVKVHFTGYADKWDEWIEAPSDREFSSMDHCALRFSFSPL